MKLKKWFSATKATEKTTHEKHAVNRTPSHIPGIIPVKPLKDLLLQHSGCITQIRELVGLSEQHFDHYYLSAIQHYARFVQQLPASEVHHHAGLGGMLTHALEVCVIALKIRRSYLLSETGGAEEIAQKQDVWTYAIFIAALCHDLAKVAVDQKVTVYDDQLQGKQWNAWHRFIDEQGSWYTSEFLRDRQYKLHEKASPLLIHRIIPTHGMNWIGSDQTIFSRWLACLSGDSENASSIGEIISQADGKSVSANLGADNSRMPTVKTKPLHEKMLTALRYLLTEGNLPLNRNGAAGWVIGDNCWLVSKRTVDAIRDQLTQEGHSGIPTKNGRMFDILQEQGVIIANGDKAIWSATIEGEDWSNDLTLIKVATHKIWINATQRPNDFAGTILTSGQTSEKRENAQLPSLQHNSNESKENQVIKDHHKTDKEKQNSEIDSQVENLVLNPGTLEPLRQEFSSSQSDDDDLLAFLPTAVQNESNEERESVDQKEKEQKKNRKSKPMIVDTHCSAGIQSIGETALTTKKEPIHPPAATAIEITSEPVSLFFDWLHEGIKTGRLKTNQAKARIHRVDEGAILITPGIFQDCVRELDQTTLSWTMLQQKVLKKKWHVRNDKGLNIVKYQVKGPSKQTTINAILFRDVATVFGAIAAPDSNPHLSKVN